MATPVGFEGSNFLYTAPKGHEEQCSDLEVFKHDHGVTSCWRLSTEELEEVNRTGVVWLDVMSFTIYPVLVSGEALVRIGGKPAKAEPVLPRAPRRPSNG